MFKKIRQFQKQEGGMMVVDLSILLPFILFVTFSSIILSLTVWSKIVVMDAAREGARYQALGFGSATEKVVEVLKDGGLNPDRIDKTTVEAGSNYITVKLEYKQPSILPLLPVVMGGQPWDTYFSVHGASVFKIEKP